MNAITVCYSTHRPETIDLTAGVMEAHELIILEEPIHPDFSEVLAGNVNIEEHLLELDVGYPEFTRQQYHLLQQLYRQGKSIQQIEPYLENLLRIQFWFADGMRPEEIKAGSVESSVYLAERNATAALLSYYETVRGDNFGEILVIMNRFAKADAARFVLRDTLRAKEILQAIEPGKDIYIEAGSIHLLLFKLLSKSLPQEWRLEFFSADSKAVQQLKCKGTLLGPGDILTLHYIRGNRLSKKRWEKYCAQALIYSKIVIKDEINEPAAQLSHTRNELESIAAVKKLSTSHCRELFFHIRSLSSEKAAKAVQKYVKNHTYDRSTK